MSFVDRDLQCLDCQQSFVFTAGEQEFYDRKGFKEEPKRCKPCREQRKQRRGDQPVARVGGAPRGGNGGGNGFGHGRGGNGGGEVDDSIGNRAAPAGRDDDFGNRSEGGRRSPAAAGGRGGGGREREREMFDATCAQCGANARVPFKPAEGRPVYCRECYASRAATAGAGR
jgi:CxxC-x17-CxxC domain-containing protein